MLLVVGAMAAMGTVGRARACKPVGPIARQIDSAMVGVDQTPPSLPQPVAMKILSPRRDRMHERG